MADDNNNSAPTGEQQDATTTTSTQQSQEVAQQPESGQGDDYKGAGSKDALKADLADERGKRQALEQQFATLKDGLAKALGIETEKATPEQLAEQATTANQRADAAEAKLAVFLAAPAGVDVQALLDSQAFTATLAATDRTPDAIAAAVTEFVTANPRFRTAPVGAGARDAAAGAGAKPASASVDDWIRGR